MPSCITTIQGVVDSEVFCPGSDGFSFRAQLGIPSNAPVAGMVARIKPGRGHDLLLDAWGRLHQEIPHAHLIIAGRGELTEHITRRANSPTFGGTVKMVGYSKDLVRLYRCLDVKVILVPGNDGTCRAALEAMACGKPVIAAKKGALLDIVNDGESGIHVETLDATGLSTALVRALSDRELCSKMGKVAWERAVQDFTLSNHFEQVESIYRTVIASKECSSFSA